MGRRKLSQDETERIRDAILAQAQILFVAHGYAGVSLRSIAAAAGCSAMTPYRYFINKADIFDAVRCAAFERFSSQQELTAKEEADPLKRMRALGHAYANFADEFTNEFRLMFELDQYEDPSNALRKAEKRSFLTLLTAVKAAVAANQLSGDPTTLAHGYWTALHGIVTLDLAGKLVHGRKKKRLLRSLFGEDSR